MIALLKHKVNISTYSHGFSIVEVKTSVKSILSNISHYNRLFNDGIIKFKITKIYHQFNSTDTINVINKYFSISNNTLITDRKDILRTLFKYGEN